MAARVLVAEDDEKQANLLRVYLEREGHSVQLVSDGRAALDRCRAYGPDLVVLDVMARPLTNAALATSMSSTVRTYGAFFQDTPRRDPDRNISASCSSRGMSIQSAAACTRADGIVRDRQRAEPHTGVHRAVENPSISTVQSGRSSHATRYGSRGVTRRLPSISVRPPVTGRMTGADSRASWRASRSNSAPCTTVGSTRRLDESDHTTMCPCRSVVTDDRWHLRHPDLR